MAVMVVQILAPQIVQVVHQIVQVVAKIHAH